VSARSPNRPATCPADRRTSPPDGATAACCRFGGGPSGSADTRPSDTAILPRSRSIEAPRTSEWLGHHGLGSSTQKEGSV
jgi:hypothetical protein